METRVIKINDFLKSLEGKVIEKVIATNHSNLNPDEGFKEVKIIVDGKTISFSGWSLDYGDDDALIVSVEN